MRGLNRRQFIGSTLALGASYVWGASPKSLDPIDPYMRFGITGALWGDWPNGNLRMSTDMRQIISDTSRFGLQGIEPYARQLGDYVTKPLALKQLCEASGITLIDVGDLPPAQVAYQAGLQSPTESLDQLRGQRRTHRRHGEFCPRLSRSLWLRSLEDQHGQPSRRRPQRRPAQDARQHTQ